MLHSMTESEKPDESLMAAVRDVYASSKDARFLVPVRV
jgi:hypothetical protein